MSIKNVGQIYLIEEIIEELRPKVIRLNIRKKDEIGNVMENLT